MSQNVDYKELVDAWLESEEKDIQAGATLLLKLNRNKVLYQYIIVKKERALDKLMYELKKHSEILSARVNFESKKQTEEEVRELTKKAVKAAETLDVIEKDVKGKRGDHLSLPDAAQKAYEENLLLYPKMRSLHEKLKLMVNDRPCDRYPFLKELVEFDSKVRANWKLYDNAIVVPAGSETVVVPDKTVLDAKGVSAARKYLSANKKKLSELKGTDETKYNELLANMQKRYDDLIASGQTFDENQVKELEESGLNV